MTDERIEKNIVEPAARDAHTGHRGLYVLAAISVLSLVGLAVLLFSQHGQIEGQQATIDRLQSSLGGESRDVSTLIDQVHRLGGTPAVPPPPPPGAQGPTGSTGPVGPQGPPGPAGPQGPAGRDGQSPPCLADPAHCQGAAGQNGIAGPEGATGPAGPVGPSGAQGTAGPAGPQGPAGPTGATGPSGEQGPPGPTCPDGYSAQSRQQGLETWWVCVATASGPTATTRK